MDYVKINSIVIQNNRIEIRHEVSEGLKPFFNSEEHTFWLDYSEDISKVAPSIAVIPFVCDVLPIVWLTDAMLILPEIDKTFYDSINEFKQGYIDMYPMFEFKGLVEVSKIVENTYNCNGGNALFFSGGVDSFSSLINHQSEDLTLITLRGSDVQLDDIEGWNNVYDHINKTAEQFNLLKPVYVTSNFRPILNTRALSRFVKVSGDTWWHGFQHGIGIISHAAPIAYLRHFAILFIASSQTGKGKTISMASDPTIDNHIRFGSTTVRHEQFDISRQEKIQDIVAYCKEEGQSIDLHVCWESRGGDNCCHCEKCYRTMYELMAEGEDPKRYGFCYSNEDLEGSKDVITSYCLKTRNDSVRYSYSLAVQRFRYTQSYKKDKRINWVYRFDPFAQPSKPTIIKRGWRKLKRIARRIKELIKTAEK